MKTQLTDRQAARRDRVITAAMDLASTGGYDAVQMREVAANADVALGTLYRYFSSKDQLLVAVLGYWAKELQQQIADRPLQVTSVADRVSEVLRRAARALDRAPQLTSALVTALSTLSADDPPALEATREVYVTVTEIIRGAMDDPNVISDAVIRYGGSSYDPHIYGFNEIGAIEVQTGNAAPTFPSITEARITSLQP